MKKQIKKQEEIKKEFVNSELEILKIELDRYVDTLTRYCFLDVCTSGAYFNNLFQEDLKKWFELNHKLKDNAHNFMELMFGEPGLLEEEKIKKNIEYYKRLIGWAKNHLSNCSVQRKKEIVRDCLEQQQAWNKQFSATYDLQEKLNKEKKEIKEAREQ